MFQAERSHPGLAEEFLGGVLQAEGATVNLPEALLQLACRDGDQYTIPSDEKEYVLLNERARGMAIIYPTSPFLYHFFNSSL